jgi:hypothetical protein
VTAECHPAVAFICCPTVHMCFSKAGGGHGRVLQRGPAALHIGRQYCYMPVAIKMYCHPAMTLCYDTLSISLPGEARRPEQRRDPRAVASSCIDVVTVQGQWSASKGHVPSLGIDLTAACSAVTLSQLTVRQPILLPRLQPPTAASPPAAKPASTHPALQPSPAVVHLIPHPCR